MTYHFVQFGNSIEKIPLGYISGVRIESDEKYPFDITLKVFADHPWENIELSSSEYKGVENMRRVFPVLAEATRIPVETFNRMLDEAVKDRVIKLEFRKRQPWWEKNRPITYDHHNVPR